MCIHTPHASPNHERHGRSEFAGVLDHLGAPISPLVRHEGGGGGGGHAGGIKNGYCRGLLHAAALVRRRPAYVPVLRLVQERMLLTARASEAIWKAYIYNLFERAVQKRSRRVAMAQCQSMRTHAPVSSPGTFFAVISTALRHGLAPLRRGDCVSEQPARRDCICAPSRCFNRMT